jgi:hypothetical protein
VEPRSRALNFSREREHSRWCSGTTMFGMNTGANSEIAPTTRGSTTRGIELPLDTGETAGY